jgi:hypothetical protein
MISLTQGKVTLVDDEDYDDLIRYKWEACRVKTDSDIFIVKCRNISMHRYLLQVKDNELIDHRDGDSLNNQKNNLRICTKAQNMMNSKKTRGLSKFKGVSYNHKNRCWIAYIKLNYKQVYLGSFNIEETAALAYNKKAIELFGDFARLNVL